MVVFIYCGSIFVVFGGAVAVIVVVVVPSSDGNYVIASLLSLPSRGPCKSNPALVNAGMTLRSERKVRPMPSMTSHLLLTS